MQKQDHKLCTSGDFTSCNFNESAPADVDDSLDACAEENRN